MAHFLQSCQETSCHDDLDILEYVDLFLACACKHEQFAKAHRSAGWLQWLKDAAAQPGQAKLHKFSRGPAPWGVVLCSLDSRFNDVQHDALERAGSWHSLWLVKQPPLLDFDFSGQLQELESLEVLQDVEEVRQLAKTFKATASVGGDFLHPRHLALLSDSSIRAFLLFARLLLILGVLPSQIDLLIISLIPKPSGGNRPIGIFPTCLHIISKLLRRSYGTRSLEQHARDYMYGAKGRSALDCAWLKAFQAEHARIVGWHSAAALLDLQKAYEHVPCKHLQTQSLKHGFNQYILRYLITIYSMLRSILIAGVATPIVRATRTIVPGDSFADMMMALAIMSAIDSSQEHNKHVSFAVPADDVQLFVTHRSPVFCSVWAAEAINYTIEQLEGPCYLTVARSKEKLSLLTSSNEVHKRISALCPRVSQSGVQSARNLGLAFALRGRPTQFLFATHFKEAKCRASRLKAVRKAGIKVKNVINLGAQKAAMYGTAVMGYPPSRLAKLRTLFHSTIHDHASSRSCTIDFALDGKLADPAFSSLRGPIMHCLASLWNCLCPRVHFFRTLSTTVASPARHPYTSVAGPVSACVHALCQIGRSFDAGLSSLQARNGKLYNISRVSPRTIEHFIHQDIT